MGQIHSILAVEKGLEKTSRRQSENAINRLNNKQLFSGQVRDLEMFDAADELSNERIVDNLDTTVDQVLETAFESLSDYWNVVLQKEASNQVAVGDKLYILVWRVPDLSMEFVEQAVLYVINHSNAYLINYYWSLIMLLLVVFSSAAVWHRKNYPNNL